MHPRGLGGDGAGRRHLDGVVAEVGQAQVAEQQAAVGVRVGAHAAGAPGGEVGQLGLEPPAVVEELRGPVALHPLLEQPHVGRVLVHLAHRHLVRAPVVLGALAVDLLRARPALGGAEHDHGPAGTSGEPVLARVGLDALDLADDGVQGGGHELVHLLRLGALDEVRRVPVAAEELVQLLVADPGQDAGIGDLVAVEVEDRQDHAVGHGAEELVRVPARRQRPRLRLAVADDAGDDQVGIVEGGAVRVRDGVAELAALVHRPGGLRRHVAGNAAREGELGEQALHALLVLGDVRVHLAVGAFEVGVGDQAGSAVPGSGDVQHVQVVLLDHPVQVDVDEVEAGGGPPVAQEARLDVLLGQGLLEQRVVVEIDLADRQVVGGPPVRVQEREFLVRQCLRHESSPRFRGSFWGHASPGSIGWPSRAGGVTVAAPRRRALWFSGRGSFAWPDRLASSVRCRRRRAERRCTRAGRRSRRSAFGAPSPGARPARRRAPVGRRSPRRIARRRPSRTAGSAGRRGGVRPDLRHHGEATHSPWSRPSRHDDDRSSPANPDRTRKFLRKNSPPSTFSRTSAISFTRAE